MSIVRIGLAETKDFAEGYDAIFGKKDKKAEQPKTESEAKAESKPVEEAPKNPAK